MLGKINNHPRGENSTNLVILVLMGEENGQITKLPTFMSDHGTGLIKMKKVKILLTSLAYIHR
jgi:hypothetical protein